VTGAGTLRLLVAAQARERELETIVPRRSPWPRFGPLTPVTPPGSCDIAVVGAGITGLATACKLERRDPDRRVAVFEREGQVAWHQTGVIHAGIYYRAGSLKAQLCTTAARELYAFCGSVASRTSASES
jgi:hypothetical protein